MENKFGIFHSETYGDLRIIIEDGILLLCARDLGTMLGFKDIGSVINHHCQNVRKRKCPTSAGMQAMNFIDTTDAAHLLSHTTSIAADDIAEWLFSTVIPTVLKEEKLEADTDETEENPAEEPDDTVFLIHAEDYIRHVYHMYKLTGTLHRLAVMAEGMPEDCAVSEKLRETAKASRKICENILSHYGLTPEDAYIVDPDKLYHLAENEVCHPEEAGYFTSEEIADELCDAVADCILEWCGENG